MILQCKHCGAPLEVASSALYTKCNYCGTTSKRRELTTQHTATPPNWRPPPVWSPPPTFQVQTPLPYTQVSRAYQASGTGAAVGVLMTLVFGAGIAFYVWRQVNNAVDAARGGFPSGAGATWDGRSALRCRGNERIEVSGVDLPPGEEVAIDASGLCEVRVSDSTLRADVVVHASGAAKVYLTNVKLLATTTAVSAENSALVELHATTVRMAEGRANLDGVTAFQLGFGAEHVTVEDSTIVMSAAGQPGDSYLARSGGGTLTLRGGRVEGRYRLFADFMGGDVQAIGVQIAPTAIEGSGADNLRGITAPSASAASSASSGGAARPGAPRAGDPLAAPPAATPQRPQPPSAPPVKPPVKTAPPPPRTKPTVKRP